MAYVENSGVYDTAFLAMCLPGYRSHWQCAHARDCCLSPYSARAGRTRQHRSAQSLTDFGSCGSTSSAVQRHFSMHMLYLSRCGVLNVPTCSACWVAASSSVFSRVRAPLRLTKFLISAAALSGAFPITPGYCWRTQKYRNLSILHAFFEGKKAGESEAKKRTA